MCVQTSEDAASACRSAGAHPMLWRASSKAARTSRARLREICQRGQVRLGSERQGFEAAQRGEDSTGAIRGHAEHVRDEPGGPIGRGATTVFG